MTNSQALQLNTKYFKRKYNIDKELQMFVVYSGKFFIFDKSIQIFLFLFFSLAAFHKKLLQN